ncbi:none [Leptomonas seymouri]|uniref:None n=1 Tax=Leptomonas seymouri TaxID=5684 RepID=A0A0N0P588_LEPSE|nr:none [Leptomonas seymouri]|eukprot:KPI85717.1 none [Leptomonas seymouri]
MELRSLLVSSWELLILEFYRMRALEYDSLVRGVILRRELSARCVLLSAESVEFSQIFERERLNRRAVVAGGAWRINVDESVVGSRPAAVFLELKQLLEEEEDERELLQTQEVRTRRRSLASRAVSICGWQGVVESDREASVSQDTRSRCVRDRNRGAVGHDILERWVRFNR